MDGQTHAALGAATALVVIRPTEPTALIATAVNLLGLAILIGFSIFGGTQPHRGFTHSVLALLIASFSAYLIFKNLALAFCIGYASHLLIDMVNKKGEQLLYPMPNRWCFNLCKANGLAALCTRMASYLVCIGYAAYLGLC